MTDKATLSKPRRVTLDGQLIDYWEREARRLDRLAQHANFKWMARTYLRKAERARANAARSRDKEIARGNLDASGAASV